jgi:hypothetical protein
MASSDRHAGAAEVNQQPESQTHGEAWRRFCKEMAGRRYGDDETRQAWLFFLAGWLGKAKQQDELRGRR